MSYLENYIIDKLKDSKIIMSGKGSITVLTSGNERIFTFHRNVFAVYYYDHDSVVWKQFVGLLECGAKYKYILKNILCVHLGFYINLKNMLCVDMSSNGCVGVDESEYETKWTI